MQVKHNLRSKHAFLDDKFLYQKLKNSQLRSAFDTYWTTGFNILQLMSFDFAVSITNPSDLLAAGKSSI
eukprot:snap_masked-scaffold_11-processed-gene-6.23-mRNA-1 protein AED:1.00 eAED:1.00 QI:0/0/0/0/1/1/2/0/68